MRTLSVSSALVMLALVSCKTQRDNPNHCQNNDGNDWCAERFPDRPFCSIGSCSPDVEDGCLAARPEDDACYSPCGDDQTFEDDPSCDGVADTGTDSTTMTSSSMSDTAPTATTNDPTLTTSMSMSASESESATEVTSETDSTTGPIGCLTSDECTDPAAPICENLMCVPCGDATDPDGACEDKDASAPACRDDGQCVQCTGTNASACGDVTPVCGDASECVGCTYHEQCPESACQIDTGACFDDTCVVTVDGDGAAQYSSIAEGITNGCVVIVHELDDDASYQEALSINGMSVALLAADGQLPRVQGTGGDPTLTVSGGADVYVQGLTLSLNGSAEGVLVDGASVWLDRSRVVQNTGGGVTLTNGADGQVRNCYVGGNSDVPAMTVNGSSVDVRYSTLGGFFDAPALACTSPNAVTVRNSIVVSRAVTSDIDCDDAVMTYSATEVLVEGMGNVAVGAFDAPDATAWFLNYNSGNFGLTPGGENTGEGEFGDVAQWQPGDPDVDIDGDPRPTEPGPDAAGADVP
jgi:hypothetical protein